MIVSLPTIIRKYRIISAIFLSFYLYTGCGILSSDDGTLVTVEHRISSRHVDPETGDATPVNQVIVLVNGKERTKIDAEEQWTFRTSDLTFVIEFRHPFFLNPVSSRIEIENFGPDHNIIRLQGRPTRPSIGWVN